MTRETLENMAKEAGVPITEYINDRRPVINGRCYKGYVSAYKYLYGKVRRRKAKSTQ